jgi:tetratricopeptide (TPR) repeat protein
VEWSRRYERAESDLFTLQTSLASDIAASLRVTLTPAAAHYPTRDARAQDYFMRGRYEADQLTRESLLRAIANYEHAIQIDPGYAAAHYGLAVARHRLPSFANDPRLFDRAAIEREYQKAIDLDPNFPEPHTGLALLAAYIDWDWARAERELETASAIAPNAMAESHSALLALIRGKRAAVPEHIRRARDLDPLGVAILMNTGEIQVMAGEYQAGREVLERFSAQHPEVDNARLWTALSFLYEGKPEDALSRLQGLKARIPETDAYMAAAHALAGRRPEALRLLRAYQARPDRSEAEIAMVYGYLRDETQTLSWLEKSVARRQPAAAYLGVHPAFAFMRANPAFQEMARRHGLSY